LGLAFGGGTVQRGENEDSFVDWRFRVGYDITDSNLLYLLVATGNKAPSFNDTVDLDPAHPGTSLFTPPVGPEKATMFEIGSKNTFQVGGRALVFNASAYYTRYTDQVFSTLVGLQLLDKDPSNDAGCLDTDPNTPCASVTLNQNIGKSKNMGVQLDSAYSIGGGFNVAATLLWQHTQYDDGSIVTDGRRGSPSGGTLQVDLGGNELPRTPPITFNLRLTQDIPVSKGTVDWTISGTYKSRQYLTGFNGGPGNDGGKLVTAVDAQGVATAYGASQLRLFDKVDSYAHLDVGVGFTHEGGKVRVEGFINNLTDEAHASQAVIDATSQEFVFNPPRTYGARVKVSF
jgi:iron complex outermembrane receptor protein